MTMRKRIFGQVVQTTRGPVRMGGLFGYRVVRQGTNGIVLRSPWYRTRWWMLKQAWRAFKYFLRDLWNPER